MRSSLIILLLLTMHTFEIYSGENEPLRILWDNGLELPPLNGQDANPGVAGAFSGIVDNRLLIIGGANFPDKMPWDGGTKQWCNALYAFDFATAEWEVISGFLDKPLAYGVSIQAEDEIICIGGCDAESCYPEVWSVKKEDGRWRVDTGWPALPVPLACGTGVLCDNKIYLFGGQTGMKRHMSTSYSFVLDLNERGKGWQSIPAWPGDPKGYAVSVASGKKIYLFSGRNYDDKGLMEMHTDGFVYSPGTRSWELLEGIFPVMAGTAFTDEKGNIYFAGGVERLLPPTAEHPGFSRTINYYNVKTRKLLPLDNAPFPIPVTTNLVKHRNNILITSGEIRPGVRTPHILRGEF